MNQKTRARCDASDRSVEEGAVRVAAINRQQFEVTDYQSASQILAQPDRVASLFPAALCDAIGERAAASR